ncbi:hypothetical protein [Burkholderia glumae]|uniref:hypothetical protein n=5 Tax=Burkholderia glumae TaxID=337 RepID=UPI00148EAB6D|nr:hypothetical protein [Burkholderia glumae]QJW81453.1 hypothetical protein GAS18_22700 [Burkholderia glumae]
MPPAWARCGTPTARAGPRAARLVLPFEFARPSRAALQDSSIKTKRHGVQTRPMRLRRAKLFTLLRRADEHDARAVPPASFFGNVIGKYMCTFFSCLPNIASRIRLGRAHQSAANRLRRLSRQHPCYYERPDPIIWAQHCMGLAASIIDRPQEKDEPDCRDGQALLSYSIGLAAGFYGIAEGKHYALRRPIPDREWSESQLYALQALGLEHGSYIRLVVAGTASGEIGKGRPDRAGWRR